MIGRAEEEKESGWERRRWQSVIICSSSSRKTEAGEADYLDGATMETQLLLLLLLLLSSRVQENYSI